MKKVAVFLFAAGLCASALCGPVPTIELLWRGKATPFYGSAPDAQQQKILDVIRNGQLAERMAAVAQGFRLRHDISVGFESCGMPNAFFSPQRQVVIICTEFVELVVEEAKSDQQLVSQLDGPHMASFIGGVIWGVYFHELAHALIHVNNIGITGREEDVADQFSLWYAVNFVNLSKQPIVTPVVWFWGALAKQRDLSEMSGGALRQMLANEHSLDSQRIFNIACWALGANPEMGGRTAKFAGLPESRAARCPAEYIQINAGMRTLFVKYIKPQR